MRSFFLVVSGLLLGGASVLAAPVDSFRARSFPLSDLADTVLARAVGSITFGPHVQEDHKASIITAVNRHHDALPADHVAKSAAKAYVYGTGWHSTDADQNTHATVKYYRDAALNNKNMLGSAHHVYQRSFLPAESLSDSVFARAVGSIAFGPHVPEDHKASITTAVNQHHDALPADHVAKGAAKAYVYGTGWHSNNDDQKTHATVKYYRDAAFNKKNELGSAHYVYQRSF